MKARALAYAQGDGPEPRELTTGRLIDRFGSSAVYGRPLGFRELNAILTAESIVKAWNAREQVEDWVKWAIDNPEANRLLTQAQAELVQELGIENGDG